MAQDFFYTYFLEPIARNGWFNPVNTLVYSVVLVIAVFLVYKLLKKFQIHINFTFFIAILPFIFWGSSTRVLHDAAVAGVLTPEQNAFYSSLIFPTPGSYIITFLLAFTVFIISVGIQKFGEVSKIKYGKYFPDYWKIMFVVGWILVINNFLMYPAFAIGPAALIVGVAVLWTAIFFGISRLLKSEFFKSMKGHVSGILTPANQGILSAHFLDASATFIAISFFGYAEQHVIPRLVFPAFGPISLFVLKIVVVIPVLYLIDRYAEQEDFRNFLKIVVLILGLAPGLRDTIRLAVGV